MTLRVTVSADGARFRAELEKRRVELRRAMRFAVNQLAWRSHDAIKAEMQNVFRTPTPWVLRGMRVVRVGETVTSSRDTREEDRAAARASDTGTGEIVATVEWREGGVGSVATEGGGAVPASKILRAQIEGGQRRLKRFEHALRKAGLLPEGMQAAWAFQAPLNRYHDLSGGRITAILSDLRLFSERGYKANRAAGVAGKYFVIRGGSNSVKLPPGIYERPRRRDGRPRLMIAYVKAGTYKPRLNPAEIARRVVARDAAEVWAAEMARLQGRWGV